MKDIKPPKHADDYPDRALDCEFEVEPAFVEVAVRAERAGWSEDEVASALLALAASHIKAIMANRDTDAKIESAISGTFRN